MKDSKELERIISEINNSVDKIRKTKPKKIRDEDLPSNVSLMLSGITNSKAIDFLFSQRLDVLLEKLIGLIMSGELLVNVEKFFTNEDELKKFFDSLGFGKGSFEGPISQTILGTIRKSMDSKKYSEMKGDVEKITLVYKNLKMKWWSFWNKPDLRKKYEQAMKAIEVILMTVSNVYKNRLKIIKGLGNIVVESVDLEESVEGKVIELDAIM
jgi:hypothetical protein